MKKIVEQDVCPKGQKKKQVMRLHVDFGTYIIPDHHCMTAWI